MATINQSNEVYDQPDSEASCTVTWNASGEINPQCVTDVEARGVFTRPGNVKVNATPDLMETLMEPGGTGTKNYLWDTINPVVELGSQKPADAISLEYWVVIRSTLKYGLPLAPHEQDSWSSSHHTHTY